MLNYLNQLVPSLFVMLFVFNCVSSPDISNISDTSKVIKSSTASIDLKDKINVIEATEIATQKMLEEWTAFYILRNEIKKLESGFSSVFDLGEKDIQEMFSKLKKDTPPALDNNNIWARIKVLETQSYKFYHNSLEKTSEPLQTNDQTNSTLTAYNNLVRQINKTHEKSTIYKTAYEL